MNRTLTALSLLAAAGVAAPALAQDSVSVFQNLPGDAISPYDANDQVLAYVVDLTPFQTSGGTTFGIAPVIKAAQTSPFSFYNNLVGASYLSQDLLLGVPYVSSQYRFWTQPGGGANITDDSNEGFGNPNDASLTSLVSGSGTSSQFGLAVRHNSNNGGLTQSTVGISAALVNFDPEQPGRLYVTRYEAAINGENEFISYGSLGLGSVDASGNVYYRADNNSAGSFGGAAYTDIAGNNIFRTDATGLGGNSRVNVVSGTLASLESTVGLVTNSGVNYGPPSNIPESIAGAGVVAGPNFDREYFYGSSAPVAETTAHRGSGDHRGTLDGVPGDLLARGSGAVYTFAVLGSPSAQLNLWATNASGAVVGAPAVLNTPGSAADNATGVTVGGFGSSPLYGGALGFRGGVGAVALGADRAGNALVATTYALGGSRSDPRDAIVVGRFPVGNPGAVEWATVAYNTTNAGADADGKPILGAGGEAIGRLAFLSSVTGPGGDAGPSLSAPTIDGAGNVWFTAAVELYDRIDTNSDGVPDASDFDTALIRAIYDGATFSYTLELVFELGQRFEGQNSGRPYQISFLNVGNGDTVSDGAVWSGATRNAAYNNIDLSLVDADEVPNADPRTLGGLAVPARITYDSNDDGSFDNSDESYQVLLYVGNLDPTVPATDPGCPADFDGNGTVNVNDLLGFLGAFRNQDEAADFDDNGSINVNDLLGFLGAFRNGCPGA